MEKITPKISVQQWCSLSSEVRTKLHEVFGLRRSTGAEVNGGVCVCDGHSALDLEAITLEKMQAYLDSKEKDFYVAFNACVEKCQVVKPIVQVEVEKPVEATVEPLEDVVEEDKKVKKIK
jgi:hypothetical protein